MVARLHRAAEQERAVQEGRRPAQRAGPDPAHLLQARLRLDRPRRPAAAASGGWASTPSASPASTAARPRCSRRRSSTTATSCCASAPTAGCCRAQAVRALGSIGIDFARDTADVTDRENIQYHWIRIEDVPAIWDRLDAAGLSSVEACGDSPRPFLGSPVAGVAKDEIIDGSAALEEIYRRYIGDPRVLQPAAQVQDRRDRPPQPRRLPRDQRRGVRRHRAPRARPGLRPVGRRRPVHQPDAGPEARRLDPARRGAGRLGGRRLGLPRLRLPPAALPRPPEVPGRRLGRRRSSARSSRTSTSAGRWSARPRRRRPSGHRDHVGVHEQKDGNLYVGVAPTAGRVSGDRRWCSWPTRWRSTPSPARA